MKKTESKDKEMRFLLLQESVWNNGDKITNALEHLIAQDAQLLRLVDLLQSLLQRLGVLSNGGKPGGNGK